MIEQGYWLDRATGGVCCTISAKKFTIVRGDDARYWEWLPHNMESRSVNNWRASQLLGEGMFLEPSHPPDIREQPSDSANLSSQCTALLLHNATDETSQDISHFSWCCFHTRSSWPYLITICLFVWSRAQLLADLTELSLLSISCLWQIVNFSDCRFSEVAYSKAAVLVEVSGVFNCSLPQGRYTLSWRLQLAGVQPISRERHLPVTAYTLEHTKPVIFRLATNDGQHADSQQYLNCTNKLQGFPLLRGSHKWLEFDGGEFQVEHEGRSLELQFSMTELHAGIWSSGLLLDGIVIRPSQLVKKVPQRVGLVAGELRGSSSLREIKDLQEGSIVVVGGYSIPEQTYSMPGGGSSLNYVWGGEYWSSGGCMQC